MVTGGVDSDYLGGLCGSNDDGTIGNCFWDVETAGIGAEGDDNFGTTGKTSEQMRTRGTFTGAGWDFVEVWSIGDNQTYPYLRVYSAGDLNCDNGVNFPDFAILASHWLEEK